MASLSTMQPSAAAYRSIDDHSGAELQRAVFVVQQRQFTAVKIGLVHPASLYCIDFSRRAQVVVNPKRRTQRTGATLFWCLKMRRHPVLDAFGGKPDIQHNPTEC